MYLILVWVIENFIISVWWIAIDLVLCRGRKRLDLESTSKLAVFFVSGHRNRLDVRVGIKIDLISAMGSTFAWFLRVRSKLAWFKRRLRT